MIPKECKRLAEVDFPIAVVSKHAAKEKSIRHGHPSTLHLWWARRPLASCRAMLLALLLPDPCDEHCPEDFKTQARALLPPIHREVGSTDHDLRQVLLKFIGDFANWDLSANPTYLSVARGLVKAAHGDEPPLVVDPFAGGGSIPLEALRLGCDAFASDLNPVACLILKVMLEDIPRQGPKLGEELRRAGKEIKAAAEKELAKFYPPDPDGARPIAYLWARTVRCESPNCGAEIPLLRSFWLCKKASRMRALRYRVVAPTSKRQATDQSRQDPGATKAVEFEIFEPHTDREVPSGTVTRAKATCLCCHTVLAPERVRAQLAAQRSGGDVVFADDGHRIGGARLLAIVTLKPGEPGRTYRLPALRDYEAVLQAVQRLTEVAARPLPSGLSVVPDEKIPLTEVRRISLPLYGCERWGDLFTARQKLAMSTLAFLAEGAGSSKEVRDCMGLVLDGVLDRNTTLSTWRPQHDQEKVEHTFSRQALGIVWDFAEAVPVSDSTGSLSDRVEVFAATVEAFARHVSKTRSAQVELSDAAVHPLPDQSAAVWFTDPPYYDAVPYAHLSDFFYVWLRRIPSVGSPGWFDGTLSPKEQECVVDRPHYLSDSPKTAAYFEEKTAACMRAGYRVVQGHGIGCVVFAHKTTEGWERCFQGSQEQAGL